MTISLTSQSANTSDLLTRSQWMAGNFSNHNLRKANSKQYAHIHVFRPLPFNCFIAIGFYSQQVYDYGLWAPYSMVFTRVSDVFRRNVESNNTWNSLDKGMDVETPKQIWGSTPGPLCFEKKQNFANEVPAVSDLC
jgi:CpeT protein